MDFEYSTTGNKKIDLKDDRIELISIAGVFVDENYNVIKEYYSLVKPSLKNRVLSNYCKELTGITDKDLEKADDFNTVINDFCNTVNNYRNEELRFYTWGNFDEMALRKSIKLNSYKGEFTRIRRKIRNIQPKISNMIIYKNKVYKTDWGLQKIKYILGMEVSNTHHEALSDARDLKNIYVAYKQNVQPIKSRLEEIIDSENKNRMKSINKQIENTENKKINEVYDLIEPLNFKKLEKPLIGYLKHFHNSVDFYKYNNIKIIFHKNTLSLKMDDTLNEYGGDVINGEYLDKKNIGYKNIGLSIDSHILESKKCIKINLSISIDEKEADFMESKLDLVYIIPIERKTKNSIRYFIKIIKENTK